MLYYILQIVAFQVVFLVVYDVFLKRETFFNYNRIYLLSTAVLSFIIPFIKLDTFKAVAPKDFVVVLPEVIIGNPIPVSDLDKQLTAQTGIVLDEPSMPIWQIIFWSGMVLASIFFLFKLLKLYWLKTKNPKRWKENILIVKLLQSTAAFSFFNTVFLGEKISESEQPTILKHELVHVKQWHSIDLLVFEVMRILLWFNPLVYIYQNRIKVLHEYIADETALKQSGKSSYYNQLLNQVFETNNFSFTNTFFKKSLIKKRIAMLQKSKSKKVALIKYALLIPLVFGMLIYTSAEVKAQETEVEEITEVIEIQEISDEQLKKSLLEELKTMDKNGASFFEITDYAMPKAKKYISSKIEYYRFIVYSEYLAEKRIETKSLEGTLSQYDLDYLEKIRNKKNKTYKEYIEWKKTDEAKEIWESNTSDGVLRLLVQDVQKMNTSEKKKLDGLIDLMDRDKSFTKIIVCEQDEISTSRTTMIIESDKSKSITEVEEVQVKNIKKSIEVPYAVIENVPTFPECKDLPSNDERKKCTSNAVAKFVNKNFNTELATQLGLEGRQRISVFFKIDKKGYVTSVGARAPHPVLEEEAERVIKLLPQFIPGTQNGKSVVVPYSLPIIFQVHSNSGDNTNTPNFNKFKKTLDSTKINQVQEVEVQKIPNDNEVPFAKIDNAPTYSECKDLPTNNERKKCTSQKVAMFVNKNFNTDLAASLGLVGRQRIAVFFKIDKQGNVALVKARAPHPALEEEAKRVIKLLPQFIPGTQKGKPVVVPYSLPILFQVAADKKEKN